MAINLQELCERGQQQLMRTEYLDAEATLASAEEEAWRLRDFDTLARLYMPLQEARRQRRQRCGEGIVALDLIAQGPGDEIDGRRIVENFSHGQLLVAGWGTFAPAAEVRRLQREHKLYLETFLGAVYPVGAGRVIVIAPLEDVALPDLQPRSIDDLVRRLPAHCIVVSAEELPTGTRKGDTKTFAEVMGMWERLHAPFVGAADATVDPIQKIEGYRTTQRVDYGCELAHQKASNVARELSREQRNRS
ncbi:MAG: hypothetical protein QOF78_1860 [Phycisphaerales bacterium]|jgi:hypothetical protein|nr:hypothetical protein [Phycisphaerales bacterium]